MRHLLIIQPSALGEIATSLVLGIGYSEGRDPRDGSLLDRPDGANLGRCKIRS